MVRGVVGESHETLILMAALGAASLSHLVGGGHRRLPYGALYDEVVDADGGDHNQGGGVALLRLAAVARVHLQPESAEIAPLAKQVVEVGSIERVRLLVLVVASAPSEYPVHGEQLMAAAGGLTLLVLVLGRAVGEPAQSVVRRHVHKRQVQSAVLGQVKQTRAEGLFRPGSRPRPADAQEELRGRGGGERRRRGALLPAPSGQPGVQPEALAAVSID